MMLIKHIKTFLWCILVILLVRFGLFEFHNETYRYLPLTSLALQNSLDRDFLGFITIIYHQLAIYFCGLSILGLSNRKNISEFLMKRTSKYLMSIFFSVLETVLWGIQGFRSLDDPVYYNLLKPETWRNFFYPVITGVALLALMLIIDGIRAWHCKMITEC